MQRKIYFKNLNSLRFFAALIVLLSHVEPLKKAYGVAGHFDKDPFTIDPKFGVLLFFVLSGFLISYLLLQEMKLTGTINIKAFYLRRILRIWPLYFLIIILALAVFPNVNLLALKGIPSSVAWTNLPTKILFFCMLMPNLAILLGGDITYASQTWTIGVEEQFYLLWPWFFKKIKNKLNICLTAIFGYVAINYLLIHFAYIHRYISEASVIWDYFPISCLAIGGVYAQLIFVDNDVTKKIKRIIFSVWFQLMMLAVLTFLIVIKYSFSFCDREIYSIILAYQVCNFAANPKRIFSLENKYLSYLGKISYGLYMFHPVVIILGLRVSMSFHITSIWLLSGIIILLSVIVSALSYHFYESYFIKKKLKYSKIVSGDNTVEM